MKQKKSLCGRLGTIFSALVIVLLLTTCSDALLEPDKKPDHLLVEMEEVGMIINGKLKLELDIVDKRGNETINNIPAWLDTTAVSNKNIVEFKNGKLVAVNPGKDKVTIEVGDYSDELLVSVRPRLYMTQSVQRLDRSIPMVAGRDAALRLFLQGKEQNISSSQITIEIYQDGSLSKKLNYQSQEVTTNEVARNISTINLPISGDYIQPGLSVLVKAGGITYPKSGNPVSIDVRTVPDFNIRLVPIYAPTTGKTGNVKGQADILLEELRDMLPLNVVNYDIHAPVTVKVKYDKVPPSSDQQNKFYNVALLKLAIINYAEGTDTPYYYYGVIPQRWGGTVGLGYIGTTQPIGKIKNGPKIDLRTAVGWDLQQHLKKEPQSVPASETLAHEIGHNLSRSHAPCGDVATPDPNYPYSDASIGVFGYEVDEGDLKAPFRYKDLMSYCAPTWISDYTYMHILNFRQKLYEKLHNRRSVQPEKVLLVWGRIDEDKMVLEPAFKIKAQPKLPTKQGPYTITGFGNNGSQLFSISFAGMRVSHGNGRHFLFGIPVDRVHIDELKTLALSVNGARASQQTKTAKQVDPSNIKAMKRATGQVALQWSSPQHKMAMVKDPDTGQILGFTSSGVSEFKTKADALKLYISDGVHTTTTTVTIQ